MTVQTDGEGGFSLRLKPGRYAVAVGGSNIGLGAIYQITGLTPSQGNRVIIRGGDLRPLQLVIFAP